MKSPLTLPRPTRQAGAVLILALTAAIPVAGVAQTVPLDVTDKFYFHAKRTVGPMAILGVAAYAAILQEANAPEEWKQGGGAYGILAVRHAALLRDEDLPVVAGEDGGGGLELRGVAGIG